MISFVSGRDITEFRSSKFAFWVKNVQISFHNLKSLQRYIYIYLLPLRNTFSKEKLNSPVRDFHKTKEKDGQEQEDTITNRKCSQKRRKQIMDSRLEKNDHGQDGSDDPESRNAGKRNTVKVEQVGVPVVDVVEDASSVFVDVIVGFEGSVSVRIHVVIVERVILLVDQELGCHFWT